MTNTNWLTLNGIVANVLETPVGTNKDTGEVYGGRHQVQLQCWRLLKNGQRKLDVQTLSVPDKAPFERLMGKPVSVPVGVFADGAQLRFYYAGPAAGAGPAVSEA